MLGLLSESRTLYEECRNSYTNIPKALNSQFSQGCQKDVGEGSLSHSDLRLGLVVILRQHLILVARRAAFAYDASRQDSNLILPAWRNTQGCRNTRKESEETACAPLTMLHPRV